MRRLHPATMVVALLPKLREVLQAVLPVFIANAFSGKDDRTELFIALIGLLGGLGAIGAYLTTRFDIEGDRIVWRSGWLWKRDRQIPLEKIQNVGLHQNLLERLFRVATVEVETAAGAGPELKLRVLYWRDAEAFRDELVAAARLETRHAPTTEVAEGVRRLGTRELIIGGLTENHWAYLFFALLPSFVGIRALIRGSYAIGEVRPYVPGWVIPSLLIGASVSLVMAGWAWGAVSYILKYGNFTAVGDGTSFRVSHGLINRMQITVRRARIELVAISATILQRRIGRYSLNVATAGTFGEAGAVAPVGLMVDRGYVVQTVEELYPGVDVDRLTWQRFPTIYLRAAAINALIWCAVMGVPTFFLYRAIPYDRARFFAYTPLIFALGAVLTFLNLLLSWRKSGYAVTEEVLATQSGFWTRNTNIIPLERVEFHSYSQPPWWRKRRVWSFTVGGMARSVTVPAMREDDLLRARRLLDARFRSRRDRRGTL